MNTGIRIGRILLLIFKNRNLTRTMIPVWLKYSSSKNNVDTPIFRFGYYIMHFEKRLYHMTYLFEKISLRFRPSLKSGMVNSLKLFLIILLP